MFWFGKPSVLSDFNYFTFINEKKIFLIINYHRCMVCTLLYSNILGSFTFQWSKMSNSRWLYNIRNLLSMCELREWMNEYAYESHISWCREFELQIDESIRSYSFGIQRNAFYGLTSSIRRIFILCVSLYARSFYAKSLQIEQCANQIRNVKYQNNEQWAHWINRCCFFLSHSDVI